MSDEPSCWKCGNPLEDGERAAAECSKCRESNDVKKDKKPKPQAPAPKSHAIDFEKVHTLEDLLVILSAAGFYFEEKHPNFQKIKRFLKS